MKKLFLAFMAVAAIALVGCKDKNNAPEPKKNVEIKKIADYLYEYEADSYGTEAPSYVIMDGEGRFPIFGCSAVRYGNYYGRNLDFNINEICEFVVRAKATGEYNLDDGLWFTTHNSTYDIPNKTLWVTIREKYEKHYEFKL